MLNFMRLSMTFGILQKLSPMMITTLADTKRNQDPFRVHPHAVYTAPTERESGCSLEVGGVCRWTLHLIGVHHAIILSFLAYVGGGGGTDFSERWSLCQGYCGFGSWGSRLLLPGAGQRPRPAPPPPAGQAVSRGGRGLVA